MMLVACALYGAQAQTLPPVGGDPAASAPTTPSAMEITNVDAKETLHLVMGRSMVMHGVSTLKRVYVGNPGVLQSFTAGPSEIVLTGKSTGVSSLVLWDTSDQSRLYTVVVDTDPAELQKSLTAAYPLAHIAVDGREGRMYLNGTVPTQDVADAAQKIAGVYTKDVVSALRVVPVHGKQVQLKVRIVEVDRSKAEQYGVNFNGTPLSTFFGTTTGQYPSQFSATPATPTTPGVVSVGDALNLFLYSSKLNFGATIKDLETKQVLQVLAEPTLTAMSGESAKFLSGGEFPYPSVQGGGGGTAATVTITFRPYGVRVDFTPVVNADGTIRLKVAPEVSTLDYTNAVTVSGFVVPALATRRAETEVEIQSGQSFAVSGLLDHRTTETMTQLPGVSRLPILGKLFISKQYSHSVVELVVLVTATVIDPLSDTSKPEEPARAIPNIDKQTFDRDWEKEKTLHPKKP